MTSHHVVSSKKEIRVVLERAAHRLRSAAILSDKGEFNDAVSRAFYAFLDAAAAALLTKGVRVKTHAGTILLFSKYFVKTRQLDAKYVKLFKRAKEFREEADYQYLKKFSRENADAVLNDAREFVAKIEKLIA